MLMVFFSCINEFCLWGFSVVLNQIKQKANVAMALTVAKSKTQDYPAVGTGALI